MAAVLSIRPDRASDHPQSDNASHRRAFSPSCIQPPPSRRRQTVDTPRRIEPAAGQESAWDYPRPPRLEPAEGRIQVWFDGTLIADTTAAMRVLETYHPPTLYLPPDDVSTRALRPVPGSTYCEWKGAASYFDVEAGARRAERAAWTYFDPSPPFEDLSGYLSFYPGAVDCTIDGEVVLPQPGEFYGGWVTSKVTGPFKGSAGMDGW